MLQELKQIASRNLVNIPGWRTDRKIVVFESDDWGSIRMPSKEVYNKFLDKGIAVDKSPYCKYDSLASETDLQALFEVLKKYSDRLGNPPVITANTVVANPNFEKIRDSNFQEYYYELITDTFQKYPEHFNVFELWKEGKENRLFHPQLHGREHLNVPLWLSLLKDEHPLFLFAFEYNCWGLNMGIVSDLKKSVQAAFDSNSHEEIMFQKQSIKEGCDIFEKLFGYRSESFIANNFIWDSSLNESLFESGVKYLQGMKYQKLPLANTKRVMKRHYLGERNNVGQYYLIRNCTFEPSQKKLSFNNIRECIKQIANAFFWKKPAIISSHRLNYIGYLDTENRDRNLSLLDKLLRDIINTWPDVEFLSSDKLGAIIEKE